MKAALGAYLRRMDSGSSHREAVVAAARAVRKNPWDVVHHAGLLGRCVPLVASAPLGLSASLRSVAPDSALALFHIAEGQRYPVLAQARRYLAGVHDAPLDVARKLVEGAIRACDGPVSIGLDSACGPGAFLVAMAEAGVPEIYGLDADPLMLEIAAVACPRARLLLEAPFMHGPPVDVVVGAPPFVSRERCSDSFRFDLRRRFPWLGNHVDLVGPFAAACTNRVRPGGGIGLVLPVDALAQAHGSPWRRRFLERHRVLELAGPMPFQHSNVDVTLLVAQAGAGPALLPAHGISAEEVLLLPWAPLDPGLWPGDRALLGAIDEHSVPLGSVATVKAGLTVYGPDHTGPERLFLEPGDGRVPFAEASDFFAGERQWLAYSRSGLHRAESPGLFQAAKVVVARERGSDVVRAAVDRASVYVGDTCCVVVPTHPGLSPDAVQTLLTSPLVDGWLRLRNGRVTELTPRALREVPVPKSWLQAHPAELWEAWGLSDDAISALAARGAR